MAAQPKYISVKDSILEQWTFQREIVINKNCFTNYRDLHGDIKGIYKAFLSSLIFFFLFSTLLNPGLWCPIFGVLLFRIWTSPIIISQLSLENCLHQQTTFSFLSSCFIVTIVVVVTCIGDVGSKQNKVMAWEICLFFRNNIFTLLILKLSYYTYPLPWEGCKYTSAYRKAYF